MADLDSASDELVPPVLNSPLGRPDRILRLT
jgi:hypothetical protein